MPTAHCRSVPVSAIVATRHRPGVLARTLQSLGEQSRYPAEVIIVDASEDRTSEELCVEARGVYPGHLNYMRTGTAGAASQRNEGIDRAIFPYVLFLDDDILIHPSCIERLWSAIKGSQDIGGANAMITNQAYHRPGRVARVVFGFLNGGRLGNYAGRCFGPGLAQLPEAEAPAAIVPVDWLNTTCTLYRKDALPSPVFASHFKGASTAEDLTLSLQVGKRWKLVNVPQAQIFHDSQPGDHKKNITGLAAMELVNRHFVMRSVLERRSLLDYFKFAVMIAYLFTGTLTNRHGLRQAPARLTGLGIGIFRILSSR